MSRFCFQSDFQDNKLYRFIVFEAAADSPDKNQESTGERNDAIDDQPSAEALKELVEISRLREKVKNTAGVQIDRISDNFEFLAERLRDLNPKDDVEAAFLWLGLNQGVIKPNVPVDIEQLYSIDDIEKNKIAIDAKEIKVFKNINDKKEIATKDFTRDEKGLTLAIAELKKVKKGEKVDDKNTEIADWLAQGATIPAHLDTLVNEKEADIDALKKNFDLLGKIQGSMPYMWIPASEFKLENDKLPEFAKTKTENWYFSYFNGEYYARTMILLGNDKGGKLTQDEFYKFDESEANGWESLERAPQLVFALDPLYRKQGGTYLPDQKVIEKAEQLGMDPRMVLSHTLNMMSANGDLDPAFFNAITAVENRIPIPFPKLDKLKIKLDEANVANSISQLEAEMYRAYTQWFPGIKPDAAKWLAKNIAEATLVTIKQNGKDTKGRTIDNEHTYEISCEILDDIVAIANPERFKVDREVSQEAIEHLAELDEWKIKIKDILISKASFLGPFGAELIAGLLDATLSEVWGDIELMSEEWADMETKRGTDITFMGFMGAKIAETLKTSMAEGKTSPEGEEGNAGKPKSWFDRLFERGSSAKMAIGAGLLIEKGHKDTAKEKASEEAQKRVVAAAATYDSAQEDDTDEQEQQNRINQLAEDAGFKIDDLYKKPILQNDTYTVDKNKKLLVDFQLFEGDTSVKLNNNQQESSSGSDMTNKIDTFLTTNNRKDNGGNVVLEAGDSITAGANGKITFSSVELVNEA